MSERPARNKRRAASDDPDGAGGVGDGEIHSGRGKDRKMRASSPQKRGPYSMPNHKGVEYELVEHALTPEEVRIYDAYAGAFQIIHNNLTAALEATNVANSIAPHAVPGIGCGAPVQASNL